MNKNQTVYFKPFPGLPDAYIVTDILRYDQTQFGPSVLVRLSNGMREMAFLDELEIVSL